jgi:hypothetical protein
VPGCWFGYGETRNRVAGKMKRVEAGTCVFREFSSKSVEGEMDTLI